jgi:hypothetical protein
MDVLIKSTISGMKYATMTQSASLLKDIGDVSNADSIISLIFYAPRKKPIKNISNGLYENN